MFNPTWPPLKGKKCSKKNTTHAALNELAIYTQYSVTFAGKFFIDVSKHYSGADYDKFEFKSIEEVSNLTMRKINFIEE